MKIATRSYVESISNVHESARNMISESVALARELIENARRRYAAVHSDSLVGLSACKWSDGKQVTLAKISELEARLKEAEEKGQRAKSMAEQTRRGFVYVVSNIGAFGEGVYKIGLTRRLDPQERVDELGGASVPFRFDIHAMCYSEDAPSLENSLHKHFTGRRINAVNLRKEFFRVSLEEIETAIKDILGTEVDFIKSVKASDYYESRRLLNR